MPSLDSALPTPRRLEVDTVDLAVDPERLWQRVRHGNLATSPFVRALFAIRTLPERIGGRSPEPFVFKIDALRSSVENPGFQILVDDGREVVVGAIGKVWKADIPFVHVVNADEFARFAEPGYVKVAWALRVEPRGQRDARLSCEVRVDATDEDSWRKFRRYFLIVGPGSHFIRRSALHELARELGTPNALEADRPLPGDDLVPDAAGAITQGITIAAIPEAIWPWLVQMGCRRAGYYAVDALDNGGTRSAREIHPELQRIAVGDVLPATPESNDGFEVLRIDPGRALVLGGLFDSGKGRQLRFDEARPEHYWNVSWAFVLEPLDARTTRLHVRARAAFSESARLHVAWIRPVHRFMQKEQLQHLAARAEGRLPRDDLRDVLEGVGGAAAMALTFLTPFLRGARSHWGLDRATADRVLPGDVIIAHPRWSWTHGVEIDAPAAEVWPWVAQIGADRGGFYSYQWLENVIGCELRNAEAVHSEWAARPGDPLSLHPKAPPLRIAAMQQGQWMVAYAAADLHAIEAEKPWSEATWLFFVEPISPEKCRFISRFRSACSDDVASRLGLGPTFVEPVGFVMDRRMLLGVKERAERARANRAPIESP